MNRNGRKVIGAQWGAGVLAVLLAGSAAADSKTPVFTADLSQVTAADFGFNYEKTVTVGHGRDQGRATLVLSNATTRTDTAWLVELPQFKVRGGAEFAVYVRSRGTAASMERVFGVNGRLPAVLWFGQDGKPLMTVDAWGREVPHVFVFDFRSQGKDWIRYLARGVAPQGAAYARLRLGADAPDLNPGQFLEIGELAYYERGGAGTPWAFDAEERLDVRETVGKEDFSKYRGRKSKQGVVTVRDDGMLLVDGKPFFPIGVCHVRKCAVNEQSYVKALSDLKAIGCNSAATLMRYPSRGLEEFLDACEETGMMAYIEGVDREYEGRKLRGEERAQEICKVADLCRDRGVVLNWVIGDDTADHRTPEEVMRDHLIIHAADPGLATSSIDVFPAENRHFPYAHACDTVVAELYPFQSATPQPNELMKVLTSMNALQADIRRAGRTNQCVMGVFQVFKGYKSWKRYPSPTDIRAHVYAAIALGARGCKFYEYFSYMPWDNTVLISHPRRMADFASLTRELSSLTPLLTLRDAPRQPSVAIADDRDPKEVKLVRLLKDGPEGQLLVAVNISEDPLAVAFDMGGPDGNWEVVSEGRDVAVVQGRLNDHFAPRSTHLYRRRGAFVKIGAERPEAAKAPALAKLAKAVNDEANLKSVTRQCPGSLKIDFDAAVGKVKPMHAGGQGPLLGYDDYSMFKYLKECGMPYSRLHDVGGAYGKNIFVDIPNLFRNFDADENDPANYDFAFTDRYLSALVANGVEPYFRLGVTIENAAQIRAYRIQPPPDFAKWARICEHVVRHYTEGWANGFKHKITYWEIWNEPEDYEDRRNDMWWGSWDDYCRLYVTTAKHLKRCFPGLKIGAYGSNAALALIDCECGQTPQQWSELYYRATCLERFVREVRRSEAPLDFFSFHGYRLPTDIIRHCELFRRYFDSLGMPHVELHLNEWLNGDRQGEFWKRASLSSSIAATICGLQESPCDLAMIYDARCALNKYAPLFDPVNRRPSKAFYAFKYFNYLYQLGTSVKTEVAFPNRMDGLWATAAKDAQDRAAALLVNPTGSFLPLECDFGGYRVKKCRIVDDTRADEQIDFPSALPPYSFVIVSFVKHH